ncbi:DinB family protein [Halocola ammonii]
MSHTTNRNKAPEYYLRYIELANAKQMTVEELLSDGEREWQQLFQNIDDEAAEKPYADGKWSLKELIQHVIDVERVMSYRALMFARGTEKRLVGFDHDQFVSRSNANNRTLLNLMEESAVVRSSTIHLFKSFSQQMLEKEGHFSDNDATASVEALGYIIAGHQLHHMKVVQEKYL